MNFESAYNEVKALVEAFKAGEAHYLSADYQEAEVRKDFIDKFWIALGWDVLHNEQKNPAEQEVKVEKGVEISGAQKRADYAFYLAPNFQKPAFFVEAKRASHNLDDKDYYFQTIRYAYQKRNPFAVLTNFVEFHILDCRGIPKIKTALNHKYKSFHYSEYLDKEKFAEIYFYFSHEAIVKEALNNLAKSLPKVYGKKHQDEIRYLSIDEDFLEEIEEKREILAKALKKTNVQLDGEELTEATQKIIDRIVFIRFLEDKLIETESHINKLCYAENTWSSFIAICRKLNAKYNGVVFKHSFIDKDDFNGPADNEFREICLDMSSLQSRFLYNEIPIHILGSVYERFLGKVVHATEKRVKLQEKSEVRKAGGVFYTPYDMVLYIVRNTVGKLIDGKTPEEISKLRFADIACGSGSFLIRVFDELLSYHNSYYWKHPQEAEQARCRKRPDGVWVLSIQQKQQILLNNIYGVDIDNQAVEVAQLSLSLKLLEDETTASASEMQTLFHQKILPDMTKNIVCGNSLVGTDIVVQNLFDGDDGDLRKLNPIDFESNFSNIMRNGGFDAIVGNPPWNSKIPNGYADYICSKYGFSGKNINLFAPFVVKSYRNLINKTGIVGLLIPKVFIKNATYTNIRKEIVEKYGLLELCDFGKFPDVASDCVAPFISKIPNENVVGTWVNGSREVKKTVFKQSLLKESPIYAFSMETNNETSNILVKIKNKFTALDTLCSIKRGIELGQKAKLVKCDTCGTWNEAGEKYYNTGKSKVCKVCGEKIKTVNETLEISSDKQFDGYKLKCVSGREIERYGILATRYIKVKLKGIDYKSSVFQGDRIFVKRIANRIESVLLSRDEECSAFNTVYSLYNFKGIDPAFVLGVLNSKFCNFYYEKTFNLGMSLTSQVTIEYLKQIPIPVSNLKNATNKTQYDQIINLVVLMTKYKQGLLKSAENNDVEYYQHHCESFERQIDTLVYQLYGLTPEEIAIVEQT